jgi:hypothetical protein
MRGDSRPDDHERDDTASASGRTHGIRFGPEVGPAALSRLCEQLRAQIERLEGRPVECDVASLRCPDIRAIDALARLQLTARRLGSSICLLNAPDELLRLLELVGLLEAFRQSRDENEYVTPPAPPEGGTG